MLSILTTYDVHGENPEPRESHDLRIRVEVLPGRVIINCHNPTTLITLHLDADVLAELLGQLPSAI